METFCMIQRILTELKTKFWQWKYIPAIKKVVKSSIRSSTVMLGSFSATLKIWARISGGVFSPRNTASCLSRITFLAKFRMYWQALATLLWNGNVDTEILQNGLYRLSWIPCKHLEIDDGNGLLSSLIVSIFTSNATCVYKKIRKQIMNSIIHVARVTEMYKA